MILRLPTTSAEIQLPCGGSLDWTAVTGKGIGFECFFFPAGGGMASGDGATIADAFLSMLSDSEMEDVKLDVETAVVFDDLGHQAVRIVCQRLSGGTLESAVFAEEASTVTVATEGTTPRSMENVRR